MIRKICLFMTSVPSFYKNLLFRELSGTMDITVFFSHNSQYTRTKDFYKYIDERLVLQQKKNKLSTFISLFKKAKESDTVYYNGWDDLFFWVLALFTPKRKNCLVLESSIYEYSNKGVKKKILNLLKRLMLSRNSTCIVCGTPHFELLKILQFNGRIITSGSVGLLDFNYLPVRSLPKHYSSVRRFLYIGRISKAKGIDQLIKTFTRLTHLELHLAGQTSDLDVSSLPPNIIFHGYKSREELRSLFLSCEAFVLPSLTETWGLVIEEALYHGLPVIVSDKVGSNIDLAQNLDTGVIFNLEEPLALDNAVLQMTNAEAYSRFKRNIHTIDFQARAARYANSFKL